MVTDIGILIFVLGLIAWLGQTLSFFMPDLAVELGVLEPEGEADPTFRLMEANAEGLGAGHGLFRHPLGALGDHHDGPCGG